ncbi:hypothetical protein Golomagni_06699 [Golovinomyces magnicellulatus]|nr:hypothetical protein Golomagni_06699 [Golovinomyces magnicellulatus]
MRKTSTGIDIDAWTVSALESLSVSPVARGTGTPLSIPIDDRARTIRTPTGEMKTVQFDRGTPSPPLVPRRPPSRRDSMVKREALLKGKEGSRQRRRWENDRLVGVPNAQPPQPTDWEIKPTHPVRRMPYQLAQFWDRGVRQLVEDKTSRLQATRKKQQLQSGSATGLGVGEVPRDLRESAKRSPVVKSWVRALEEPVRQFIYDEKGSPGDEIKDEELDSEDEEIVFVGRAAAKHKTRMVRTDAENGSANSGMVFDSFGDDESASYKYVNPLNSSLRVY